MKVCKNIHYNYIIIRIAILSITSYIIASTLNLYEKYDHLLEIYEDYNVDEVFLVAVIMCVWLIGELFFLTK